MIRVRCGWPSKRMPNRSQTSRSYQLALAQIRVALSQAEIVFLQGDLEHDVAVSLDRQQVVEHVEIRWRQAAALRS
ncbi:hypothetical protein D3C71_1967410 [compost metagenome]